MNKQALLELTQKVKTLPAEEVYKELDKLTPQERDELFEYAYDLAKKAKQNERTNQKTYQPTRL